MRAEARCREGHSVLRFCGARGKAHDPSDDTARRKQSQRRIRVEKGAIAMPFRISTRPYKSIEQRGSESFCKDEFVV